MTEIAARLVRPIQGLGRASLFGVCVGLVLGLLGALVFARAMTLRESVLPGVEVAGVEVGGLSRGAAEARIQAALSERLERPVEITVGKRSFQVSPASLFAVDAAATEQLAFDAARDSYGSRVAALTVPFVLTQDVEPVLHVRPAGRASLSYALGELTQRPVDARVRMHGAEPVVVPGRAGTQVDEAVLIAGVRTAALAGARRIAAHVTTVHPALTSADAERAAEVARIAVAAPVQIAYKRKELDKLAPRELARLVRFQPLAGAYEVTLDGRGVERRVGPLVKPFTRKPVDASFRVRGSRAHVVRAKAGTTLSVEQAGASILAAATEPGVRVARVELARRAPDLTTREAKAFGIRERVSTFTTDMGPSSANRIWNVQLLGRYLDGTILKPGQTFSYNQVMGPRTAERGFREGQMIWNGLLVPAIGGGVCQTATTIFNAAFEAGLPVKERHNHSFYISHYPTGRDATVSWGGPDLVFRNDLNHALLIKVAYTSATFTVSFYGTKQRRRVVSSTSASTNFTQPKLQYAVDPSAPRNSVRRTSGGGPGFDVTVSRKVYERGKLIHQDSFFTRYTPQNPTAIYGPGKTPPGPYFYLPSAS